MDSSNESPTGSGGRRKKNHGSTHRDSAVSVDRLTKALSERRLLKRREKQNPPPKKESRKNSYLRAEKEKENVSRSNTASSRLQQSSSLPKDSLQNESFGASENSDTSSDIENQNMQKKKSKNKSSVDQLRRPVTKQIHYEENKIDQSRAEVEAEKSSSKILTNKITTKNKLTIQNENKNSTKKIGTKSDKESGSSKSKSQMNNVAEGIQRREAKRKPGKDSHKRKARRKSSESESEVESEEELATCKKQQNVSKNSAVSSARKKRRLSSSCESDDESQNENIPTQKRSGNVKQMKHQREALKIKKRDKDSSSVRQNSHVSSDSENETQNRKTTLREPLNKEKVRTQKNRYCGYLMLIIAPL